MVISFCGQCRSRIIKINNDSVDLCRQHRDEWHNLIGYIWDLYSTGHDVSFIGTKRQQNRSLGDEIIMDIKAK